MGQWEIWKGKPFNFQREHWFVVTQTLIASRSSPPLSRLRLMKWWRSGGEEWQGGGTGGAEFKTAEDAKGRNHGQNDAETEMAREFVWRKLIRSNPTLACSSPSWKVERWRTRSGGTASPPPGWRGRTDRTNRNTPKA